MPRSRRAAGRNGLDIETLQTLQEALEGFTGCAVVVSHDRWFIDRLATHIRAFEGDSHVEWFEGNFEMYEEDKKRGLAVDSLIPHRIKFQKFARQGPIRRPETCRTQLQQSRALVS